jgi:hypothetical protein
MTPKETLIRDMRRHPRIAGHADNLAHALNAMESEGYEVEDAATCLRAIEWVIAQPDTIEKRLEAISRLLALGKVDNLKMQEFYRAQ